MEDQFSPSPGGTSILALGLTEEIPPDFNALPNVATELDAIVDEGDGVAQGIYPGRKFLNEGFNFDTLFNHVLDHRILHIATHGKFVAGTPDDSYLMLGDSTRLSIQQIEDIGSDLDNVHLVVLSACETAVGGPDADGIEVAGISSYFLAARRASAVLDSLWLINDASTSILMQQFYEQWAQGNQTKAEALQQAQLALRNGDLDPALVDALSRSIVAWDEGDSYASATGGTGTVPDLSHPYTGHPLS